MIVTQVTASISKFCSHRQFVEYYSGAFAAENLRIHFLPWLINAFMQVIPFLELTMAAALAVTRLKPYFVYAWIAFFLSLEVGHYLLEEWSEVNQMIPYFLLGLVCLVLPNHRSWISQDREADPPTSRNGAGNVFKVSTRNIALVLPGNNRLHIKLNTPLRSDGGWLIIVVIRTGDIGCACNSIRSFDQSHAAFSRYINEYCVSIRYISLRLGFIVHQQIVNGMSWRQSAPRHQHADLKQIL